MLRDFYNSVLEFIGTESLTDEEFELSPELEPEYTKETFEFLNGVVLKRENVSNTVRRLYNVYFASGAITKSDEPKRAVSNIFIGAAL